MEFAVALFPCPLVPTRTILYVLSHRQVIIVSRGPVCSHPSFFSLLTLPSIPIMESLPGQAKFFLVKGAFPNILPTPSDPAVTKAAFTV